MGKVYESIDDRIVEFIRGQQMFFVATAPLAEDGNVNLSPKGLDSFLVLDEHTVAYADLAGSGIETVAHVKENGRIVIMFCAFDGAPKIVRLHGQGEVIDPGHADFSDLHGRFPPYTGLRTFIRVRCHRISDSCGFGVPLYDYRGQRSQLIDWAEQKGIEDLKEYQSRMNRQSIDGLPGIQSDRESSMTDPERSTVVQFFDSLTDQYAGAIERCFPRYREMFWALLDYLPSETQFTDILELGSGTGNLSVLLAERYPNANIDLVDVAPDSLEVCRGRLGSDARFRFHSKDFRELQWDAGSFDLVISSIAVHHLTAPEKQALFKNIFDWLVPEGVFAFADQHAGATDDLYRRHIKNWKAAAMEAGSTPDEWQMWMEHQAEHDHHDTLTDQFEWLRAAGFETVDCPWRYLLWTVVQARKRPVAAPPPT